MVTTSAFDTTDLFFESIITSSLDDPDFVSRQWLNDRIVTVLDEPGCRYLLLTGEPGAGKTVIAASLAYQHPGWLRYFIRRNSWTALSGGDIRSFLFSIGHQLAAKKPTLFQPTKLEIVINQRVRAIESSGQVVGIRIDDLHVSPFFQTALRVTQDVGEVGGLLTGIAVKEARLEPRLLDPDNLQYLALFDPAKVLAAERSTDRIVVLIDGLDELSGDNSLLNWLASSPELPDNVRFVLISRPHSSLRLFTSRRANALSYLRIEPTQPEVRNDLITYTDHIVSEASITEALSTGDVTAEEFTHRIVDKSDGNFAYLVSYCRAIREAVKRKDIATCQQLLQFTDVPSGLHDLYGFFIHLLKRDIEQLGMLEVQAPLSATDRAVPAWERVGQAILGVLAVSYETLTTAQIARFGNIRVWPRDLHNVIERLTQFLDQEVGGYRLFHSSFAEFLTDPMIRVQHSYCAIDPYEWHERILRSYRRDALSWGEVEWSNIDRYGLLHIAEHLAALGPPTAAEVAELVNPGLRRAMLAMFKTDGQFQRIIDQAIGQAATLSNYQESLPRFLGLTTVRAGIRDRGHQMTPAVLGLMARLGEIDVALEYLGIMAPSMQRFQGLRYVRAHALPADLRKMGAMADIERLVQYALDIRPDVEYMPERRNALQIAAVELAPISLTRALQLANLSGEDSIAIIRDSVFQSAVLTVDLTKATEFIQQMSSGRAIAYINTAQHAENMAGVEYERRRLLDLAAAEIVRDASQAIPTVLAKLAVAWAPFDEARALVYLNDLQEITDLSVSEIIQETTSDEVKGEPNIQRKAEIGELVKAAETLSIYQIQKAEALLEQVSRTPVTYSSSEALIDAVELWARWGKYSKCYLLVESLLAFERGLGWFGPAKEITKIATVLASFDRPRAVSLVDEAFQLIEPALNPNDLISQDQVDSVLSVMVLSLLTWDTERALKAARWINNTSWIRGSSEVGPDNRADAIALISLSLANTERAHAQELLDECKGIVTAYIDEERDEQQGPPEGIIHIVREHRLEENGSTDRTTMNKPNQFAYALSYFMNLLNYYKAERQSRLATTPADTVRWILPSPRFVGSPYRWARTFRVLTESVATKDINLAEKLLEAISDPTERAIGYGTLFNILAGREDAGSARIKELALKALDEIPHYEFDIDPSPGDPALVSSYLNPEVRARFEVILRLALFDPSGAFAQMEKLDSSYLVDSARADALFRAILMTAKTDEKEWQEAESSITAFHKMLQESGDKWRDPVHASLIQNSLAWAVASYNPETAEEIVRMISIPVYRAHVELNLAHLLEGNDKQRIVVRCQRTVKALPVDAPPHHAAAITAEAAAFLAKIDPEAAATLTREGLSAARQFGYLFYRGLAIIEYIGLKVDGIDAASLVAEVETLIDRLGSHYHAAELLCHLFPILVEMFPERVLTAISRIQDRGWLYTMAMLEYAAPKMVEHYGVGIAPAMQRALVDALACLSDPLRPAISSRAVDGVDFIGDN